MNVTINSNYFPIHLAIIYKNSSILKLFYEEMREDKDFCETVLNMKIEVDSLQEIDSKSLMEYPDELCGLTTMFLAVKYNPEALSELMKVAKWHLIWDDVVKNQRDMRNMNLLQFATLNRTTDCLKTLMRAKRMKEDRRKELYNARNVIQQGPLHTARSIY